MEYSLIKGNNLLIQATSLVHSGDKGLTKMSEKMRYTIEPMIYGAMEGGAVGGAGGPSAAALSVCKILENSLIENRGQMKTLNAQKLVCLDLRAFVTVPPRTPVRGQGGVGSSQGDGGVVALTLGNVDADACIFDRLYERFGVNATVNFEITDFGEDKVQSEKFTFSGKDLAISHIRAVRHFGVKLEGIKFPDCMVIPWYTSKVQFCGLVNLSVKINDVAYNHLYLERFSTVKNHRVTHRLLREMPADLKIRGKAKILLPCHSKVLCGKSVEIKKLIEAKFPGGVVGQGQPQLVLDLPELSQPGLVGLLDFIYRRDVKAASGNCDLALELLQAGYKYNVFNLCVMMTTLMESKGPDWFSVDMAVRLLWWTRDLETMKGLRKKAVLVLKWYNKSSPQELMNSEEYTQLFQNDPRAAMELGSLFLQWS